MTTSELEHTIVELEEEMLAAADDLRFEYAARLRDEIRDLRRELRDLRSYEAPAAASDEPPRTLRRCSARSWLVRGHGRDLPWRRTTDPYAILVSEVMLQQTQVARVAAALRGLAAALARPPPRWPRRRRPRCCASGSGSATTAARCGCATRARSVAATAGRGRRRPARAAGRRPVHRGGGRVVRVRRARRLPSTRTSAASSARLGSDAATAAAARHAASGTRR